VRRLTYRSRVALLCKGWSPVERQRCLANTLWNHRRQGAVCKRGFGQQEQRMTHTRNPSPARRNGIAVGKMLFASLGLVLLVLAQRPAQGQVLLTETTWGGTGSDVATGVATAGDGSTYLVG